MTTRRDILLLAALSALAPAAARAAGAAGAVVTIKGNCLAGSRPLKLGDAVDIADTIEVPADGKLRLRMEDGTVIALAPGTKMTVADYRTSGGQRQDAKLTLASGLLRAVVTQSDHPAVFEVSTAVGTAAVRGTDWFIEAQAGGAAQVGVLSGQVSLTSAATGRSVTIPARWGARLEAGRDPVQARVWSPAEFDAVIARTDIR